jgi:hypothetical protein
MATLQERRLGYHSRAGLEPGTSGFSTLRLNHYAARGDMMPQLSEQGSTRNTPPRSELGMLLLLPSQSAPAYSTHAILIETHQVEFE